MNMFKEKTFTTIVSGDIKQIKIAISYNDNFFVCFSEDKKPICLINDHLYNFKKINCSHGNSWVNTYKVLYFKEIDDFILISRHDLTATIFNNHNNSIKLCSTNILSRQTNAYSIIYNNGYQMVNYNTFKMYNESIDISILASINGIFF